MAPRKLTRRRRIVAAAGLLWLALFAFLAGHDSIWFDELYSLAMARLPVDRLLRTAAGDIHPPGYPLALKWFLTLAGDSWRSARWFSVLTVAGTAALLLVGASDRRAGGFAAALFLLLPATGFCATDIRMYALAMFFLAAFIWCGSRIARGGAALPVWIAWGVAAWGGALTLNYACLYLAAAALWVLGILCRRGKRREFGYALIALLAAFMAYLPWLGKAWGQLTRVRLEFWAPPLTPKMAVLILDAPFMGYSLNFLSTLIPALLAAVLLAAGVFGAWRHRDRLRLLRLTVFLTVALFPVGFGIAWSLWRGQALVIDRAMLPACVPLTLALGEVLAAPYLRRAFKLTAAAVFGTFFIYHTGCLVYRTRDGALTEFRQFMRSAHFADALFYGDAHAAADGAGLLPERRHTVLTAEADPMGILVLGNVRVAERPEWSARRVFILAEESPESFRARIPGVGELVELRHFYSRYRFQHLRIFRETALPPRSELP